LSIGGRASLQKLIADVESGAADYTLILVYDVSRWGRFQDADESAYYVAAEVMLRRQARWPISDLFCLPHRT
jgi:DNA invertase Pin-like site-specific DNA recombinase